MNYRKLLIWLIPVLLIVTVLICLAPLPMPVNLSADGFLFNADGTAVENVTISFTGWKLNFLLLDDRWNGSITVTDMYGSVCLEAETTNLSTSIPGNNTQLIGIQFFDKSSNRFSGGYFYVTTDLQYCAVSISDFPGLYAAAENADTPSDTLWEQFCDLLPAK